MAEMERFSVVIQNIRSVSKNFDEFLATIESLSLRPLLICLTEVWAGTNEVDLYGIADFNLYHCCNDDYRAGGVMMYVHKSISCSQLNVNFTSADCVHLRILVNGVPFEFLGVYRLQAIGSAIFLDELRCFLESRSCLNLYCMGDINIDLLNVARGSVYDQLMSEHGLQSLIMEPTRITNLSATCIDHVYSRSSNPRVLNEVSLIHANITDHSMLILRVGGLCRAAPAQPGDMSRTMRRTDWRKLNLYHRYETWTDVYESENVDICYDFFD